MSFHIPRLLLTEEDIDRPRFDELLAEHVAATHPEMLDAMRGGYGVQWTEPDERGFIAFRLRIGAVVCVDCVPRLHYLELVRAEGEEGEGAGVSTC